MKKKIILSAIMSIALCISLIAGATFAIFTSESKVNIAVTSGKVNLVATIDENSTQTKQLYGDYADGKDHMYQGVAEFTDDGLSLNKFLPGDGISFDIVVKNNSNVNAKYRTVWVAAEDNGLLGGLKVTVNGTDYAGETVYSHWENLIPEQEINNISVAIELPEEAGNEYQEKSCKLTFKVEAVQGNASADDSVASIGETKYDSLAEAVAALSAGDTLKITRPGTYAPFKIDKENVTVEGIIGATKADSTVIINTATENVKAYANGITLKNLYIDSTKPQSIFWMHAGAVDGFISTDSGIYARGLTLDGCVVDGYEGACAFMWCGTTFKAVNSTFNNFKEVFNAMCDNTTPESIVFTGNTFNNVKFPIQGYWGGAGMTGNDYNIVITGNKFDDEAALGFWDYRQVSQWRAGETACTKALRIQMKDNTGKIEVALTHNNWLCDNENDIVLGADSSLVNRTCVIFNVDNANYKVFGKDGSELESKFNDSTTLSKSGNVYYLYAISEGEYLVKNTVTGATFPLTVAAPEVGSTQKVSFLEKTDAPLTNDDIVAGATIVGAGIDKTTVTADKVSLKDDDITIKDMTIKCETEAGNDGAIKVSGKNTTIENVKVDGQGFNGDTKAISVTGDSILVKNTKISNVFRGIIFWDNIGGDNVIENCYIDNVIYTFNINAATVKPGTTLTVKNSTLNGWTSYSGCMTKVTFIDSNLGMSNGYAYMVAYADTEMKNCVFNDGYQFAAGAKGKTFTFTDCKLGDGTLITAENFAEKLGDVDDDLKGCTVIVNGVTVNWN